MSQIYAEKQPLMCYIGYYSEKRHASGKRAKADEQDLANVLAESSTSPDRQQRA